MIWVGCGFLLVVGLVLAGLVLSRIRTIVRAIRADFQAADVELRAADQELRVRVEQLERRYQDQTKMVAELRTRASQRSTAVTTMRTEVQKLRQRLQTTQASESPPTPEPNKAARSKPSCVSALAALEQAAIKTAHGSERAAEVRADFKGLLSTNQPMVTVVVTSYNDASYLGDCLLSVQQQTLGDFECIVVDDASADDSAQIAIQFAAGDHRFRVIQHTTNLGPSAARNTGISDAKAPFIAFLDSDDLLLAQSLEQRLFTLLQSTDPAVAGVFSGIEHRAADVRLEALPEELPGGPQHSVDLLSARGTCPFNLHAPLLRTDIVRRAKGFNDSMRRGAEDWELWLRLLRNGYIFVPCPVVLGIYRQKPQSLVRRFPADHLAASEKLIKSLEEEADPAARIAGAPFFYDRPLAHYERDQEVSIRAYQYLGLAALATGEDQLEEALGRIPLNTAPYRGAESRLAHVLSGVRRGLGIDHEDFVHVLPEARVVAHNLLSLADTQKPTLVTAVVPRGRPLPDRPIKLFYWQPKPGIPGKDNFGDVLSPMLVELVSGRTVEHAEVAECDIVALGSILDLVVNQPHQRPVIWGSGFIKAGEATGAGLDVLAVRGKATNQRCGFFGALGDPGLLVKHLGVKPSGEYRIGLLPHYVDKALPFVESFSQLDGAIVIDAQQPPLDVLAQIASCDALFSSSLHGLICADSLGIPNAWVELSNKVVGEGYKFADYYSCFDMDVPALRPVSPTELEVLVDDVIASHSRPGIDELCDGLISAFPTHL